MSNDTSDLTMDPPSNSRSAPPLKVGATVSAQEPDYSNEPGPEPFVAHYDGKSWELRIFQQPIRARMCGFGDKDRRPISPPPCIKLIVRDLVTGKEIDSKNLNLGVLIMQVDLYDKDGKTQSNGVHSTTNSPSISSVHPTAFPPAYVANYQSSPGFRANGYQNTQYPSSQMPHPAYQTPYASSTAYASPVATTPSGTSPYMNYPPNHPQQHRYSIDSSAYTSQYPRSDSYSRDARTSMSSVSTNGHNMPHMQNMPPQSPYQQAEAPGPYGYRAATNYNDMPYPGLGPRGNTGTASKNLIGNNVVNANRLKDTEDQWGIWFVTQDLSVRTEGWFRLKFSFFDLGRKEVVQISTPDDSPNDGDHPAPIPAQQSASQPASQQRFTNGNQSLPVENTNEANGHKNPALPADEANTQIAELGINVPCLAHVFSAPFQVWSAKKFPGVIESTELSKKFAGQGVKIPIRKESKEAPGGKRKRKSKAEEDSEESDADGDDDGVGDDESNVNGN